MQAWIPSCNIFLCDCCRPCKSMLIVCMAVSLIGGGHGSLLCCWERASEDGGDPPGPCRGHRGQVQEGTMMMTMIRQPTLPTAGTADDLTYYISSFIPVDVDICIHTYIHTWLSVYCGRWRRRYFLRTYIHVCRIITRTCMQCMYACIRMSCIRMYACVHDVCMYLYMSRDLF